MPVTPEENLAYLERAFSRIEEGAVAAATAMAKYIRDRARNDTLQRTRHQPGEWYRQRPGEPPARASGALIRDMFFKPASGGLRATAVTGNKSEYGRILEFGCVVVPVNHRYMHWTDSGGSWYHTVLVVPAHPYLSVTTDEAIADGSLQQAAIDAFEPFDP
jgi:hypothetical protein